MIPGSGVIPLEWSIGLPNSLDSTLACTGYEDTLFNLFPQGKSLGPSRLRVRSNGIFFNERRRNGEHLTVSVSFPLAFYVHPGA